MASPRVDALRRRLAELGRVEGRNVAFEVRYGAGQRPDGYREAAADLVARKVDVIVADNTASTRAALRQSSAVPIVMVHTGDPVGAGFAKSLARPGGNVTGQSFVGRELNLKALDLVVEAVPSVRRVGVFYDPLVVVADPPDYRPLEDAVRAKGIDVVKVRLARGGDVDAALAAAGPKLDAWLLVAIGLEEQVRLARIAVSRRVPAISGVGDGAEAGALLSYGPNFLAFWRGAAVYVDRILKGASPADLPVELPNSFELAVNQRTARALGMVLPASLRARADRAID
jgi:putative ABC transport system substrate-binding protein